MATIAKKELMAMLGKFISVKNATARCGCGEAPNQFILTYENGEAFQSYDSLIGVKMNGVYYFTNEHTHSRTTERFCYNWCGHTKKDRLKGLDNGKFTFITENN